MKLQCPECGSFYRIDPSRIRSGASSIKARCTRCNAVFSMVISAPQQQFREPLEHPAADRSAPVVPPSSATMTTSADCRGKRVLVIDDSKFFRELIVDVLKPLELDFQLAGDGVEALEILRQGVFDLVLLDLNLPRMNGYELIAAVRSDAAMKNTQLLAMSGVFRKETDVARVVQAGADDFINKSFKPEQLRERVRMLLKGG